MESRIEALTAEVSELQKECQVVKGPYMFHRTNSGFGLHLVIRHFDCWIMMSLVVECCFSCSVNPINMLT